MKPTQDRPRRRGSTQPRVGVPVRIASDGSDPIDLTDFVEESLDLESTPPSLLEDPTTLWPSHSGLHSTMLSTASPTTGAESWQNLVEELAQESRLADDPTLRDALQCEAGRLLVDRLGRKEEGELLLKGSGSPIAQMLGRQAAGGMQSLAAELATLEATARDKTKTASVRAAAWIEFGQLCEERTSNLRRAYEAYREALALVPDQPVALWNAMEVGLFLGEFDAARGLLETMLQNVESTRLRAALLLDLAELTDEPDERLIVLEQARQAEPTEETALRRLSRAVSTAGDADQLGELYRELARVAEDPISKATALHLAFLTLTEANRPVDDLVLELSAASTGGTDMLAPLAEVALRIEQRIAAGEDGGLPDNLGALERLARTLDDPREQALVREQSARLRLTEIRAATGRAEPDATIEAHYHRLESDLRFCLVHLPEHRWVNEALAEALGAQGKLGPLVLHLEEWARTQSAGSGRAAILLRLGDVHENRRRDLPRAAEVYELAVAEDPDNPDCLRALGRVYEKTRRWPQAVANLQRQVAGSHDDQEKLTALRRIAAMAEHEFGDVDLAIATFEEVARLDPDDLLSLFQLAKLCRANRRPAVLVTALQLLVERIDDDVARTAVLVELGEVLELHLKQRKAARACYERALELTPGYTPALGALGRLYRDSGELEPLVGLLEPKVDPVTDPAVLAFKAGRVCFEEIGDADRALDFFYDAYRKNPDLAPARELLMQLLTARGRIKEAYDLLRAQDLPHSAPLLADYHYRLGLLAEAIAREDRSERPGPRQAHEFEDSALQHYRAALAAQPDHGLAFERSRRLLIAHHDVANLVRLVEGQLEHGDPGTRAVHLLHLARLHLTDRAGIETARRYYEDASSTVPDDPIVRRELEGLLRLVGDTISLPAVYIKAAKDSRDTHYKATLLVEAAEILLGSGKPEDKQHAARAILDALRDDPGNPYAVRHLERLLSEPDSPFVMKDAVSARAVRAQSDAERAIFYVESAELLERLGAWGQARRAYLAAKGALPNLAPAELGLLRVSDDSRKATAATEGRTSVHVLVAEARDAAVRAARGEADAHGRAVKLIGEILQRDDNNRDAIALARTLAAQLPDASAVIDLLASAFSRQRDRRVKYELGLFLAERSTVLEDAVRYFEAAATARPDGRRALRGLVNAYRQMGDDRRAAEATERLLELFDASEPSAVDLRMGIASFLSADRETLPRAIEHARLVLEARGDDPRAIQLMADLLQRADRRVEAAALLDRLAARERGRDRLHDIWLRKARLLSEVAGREQEALDAVERAAAINPGNRDTISLLIDQLNRTGQSERVAAYLEPIRKALVANIERGAVSLRDLSLMASVARNARPDLSRVASVLLQSMDTTPGPADAGFAAADAGELRNVLEAPSLRVALYSAGEPAALHHLLQTLEAVVPRLSTHFSAVASTDATPMPAGLDLTRISSHTHRWAERVGVPPPRLSAAATPGIVMLLPDQSPSIRIGVNLWNQGDEHALRGCIAISLARFALGGARVRALNPAAMDLLLAAAFEAVGVFNPMTADPDPRRLKDLANHLNKLMPPRMRQVLERQCKSLANHAFDNITRATTSTDLSVAALITGDIRAVIAAACLLDGAAGGSLKQRVNRSPLAQSLMAHLLSDAFLAAQTAVLRP